MPDGFVDSGGRDNATSGTELGLTSTSTIVTSVVIRAKKANTGTIHIGKSDVSTSKPGLSAGEAIKVNAKEAFDLADTFFDASVSGEGIEYWYNLAQ